MSDNTKKESPIYKVISEEVLSWLERENLNIIPLSYRDKKPIESWKKYQTQKITQEEIKKYFLDPAKPHNIGVVCGDISGSNGNALFVLDFDSEEVFEQYFDNKKTWKNLCLVKSARGFHVYFKAPGALKPLKAFDARGQEIFTLKGNGYVVAPPSIHPSGKRYEFVNGMINIPLLGGNIREDIKQKCTKIGLNFGNAETVNISDPLKGVPEGGRDSAAFDIATYLRRQGSSEEEALSILRKWNAKNTPPLEGVVIDEKIRNVFECAEPYSTRFVTNPGKQQINPDLTLEDNNAKPENVRTKEEEADALELAKDPKLWIKLNNDIGNSIENDYFQRCITLLVGLSAYSDNPLNIFVSGETSSGKTHIVTRVLKYFPEEHYTHYAGMSATGLKYRKGQKEIFNGIEKEVVDIGHEIMVFLESPNKTAMDTFRPIMSHDVTDPAFCTTDKSKDGPREAREAVIRGFPAFLFCGAHTEISDEIKTRNLQMSPHTSKEKNQAVVDKKMEAAICPWDQHGDNGAFLEKVKNVFRLIKEEFLDVEVALPPLGILKVPVSEDPRIMRDYDKTVSLIRAVTVLHAFQRVCVTYKSGNATKKMLLADPTDVALGLLLFEKIALSTTTGLKPEVLLFWKDVIQPLAGGGDEKFTNQQIHQKHLDAYNRLIGRETLWRDRLKPLLNSGHLESSRSEEGYHVLEYQVALDVDTKNLCETVCKLCDITYFKEFGASKELSAWLEEIKKLCDMKIYYRGENTPSSDTTDILKKYLYMNLEKITQFDRLAKILNLSPEDWTHRKLCDITQFSHSSHTVSLYKEAEDVTPPKDPTPGSSAPSLKESTKNVCDHCGKDSETTVIDGLGLCDDCRSNFLEFGDKESGLSVAEMFPGCKSKQEKK